MINKMIMMRILLFYCYLFSGRLLLFQSGKYSFPRASLLFIQTSSCYTFLPHVLFSKYKSVLCCSELVISSDATCILGPSSGLLDLQLMYKDAQAAAQVKNEHQGHGFHGMVQGYHGYEQLLGTGSSWGPWNSPGEGFVEQFLGCL